MTGRLVLLSTSPRVAPGLLSWAAWSVLRSGRVVVAADEHPLPPYLREAGIVVHRAAAHDGALARHLLDLASTGTTVFLRDPAGDDGLMRDLSALLVAGQARSVEVELLPGSYDLPGARLLDLVATMDRLRSPGGCPWDAEQTHESLVRYLVEETYETIEAIETGDREHLLEELGDLLLQVVFHARIATEHPDRPWSVDDVACHIVEKLVRRHPHVFAGAAAGSADEVAASWEAGKAAEKGRSSAADGVPPGLPALALVTTLLSRAESAGLALPGRPDDGSVGARLLGLVIDARALDVDAEAELRLVARGLAAQIRSLERS